MDDSFGGVSKNSLLNSKSPRFSPMLSSRSFIILHFTFRYTIHIELIFVQSVRSVSRFIFFPYGYPVVLTPLVERTIFFPIVLP